MATEGWGLFSDDSNDSDDSDDSNDISNTINTMQQRKNTTATATATATAIPQRDWKTLLPKGLDSKTGTVSNMDVPWETSAVPAPIQNHAPLSNSITYQSSSIKYSSVKNVGGGRGYILTNDVPTGTLLLLEKCAVRLPSQTKTYEIGLEHPTVALLYSTLSRDVTDLKVSKDILDLKELYPKTNDELSEDYRLRKDDEFGKDLNVLVDMLMEERKTKEKVVSKEKNTTIESETKSNNTNGANGANGANSSSKNKKQKQKEKKKLRDECYNMLCSIHCNAFVNGLHFHLAMLNHSCQPNCVKLGHTNIHGNKISAIWTTKDLKKGEEATISYLLPRMQSLRSRREKLQRQFDFVCECHLCIAEEETERQKETDLQQIEHTLEYEILPWMDRKTIPPLQTMKENTIHKLSKGLATMGELLLLLTTGTATDDKQKENGTLPTFSTSMVMGRTYQAIAELCARLIAEDDVAENIKEQGKVDQKHALTVNDISLIFSNASTSTKLTKSSSTTTTTTTTSTATTTATTFSSPPTFTLSTSPRIRILILFLESLISHLEIRNTLQGPYPHAEMVDVLSDIANVTQLLLSSSPNHTLLLKRLSQSVQLFQTYNIASVRTLIEMEQMTRNAAQSIGQLYVDRWRTESSHTNNICHIVCGPPASGKTTISKILSNHLNANMILDSDIVSTRLIEAGLKLNGMDPNDRDSVQYKATYRNPVYETMYDLVLDQFQLDASNNLRNVVLCGPFTSECRDPTWPTKLKKRLGGNCRIEIHYVSCQDATRKERMVLRNEVRDTSKIKNDKAWERHVATASKKRPSFPHHYKDNSLTNKIPSETYR